MWSYCYEAVNAMILVNVCPTKGADDPKVLAFSLMPSCTKKRRIALAPTITEPEVRRVRRAPFING
jgi:hypothetical protein